MFEKGLEFIATPNEKSGDISNAQKLRFYGIYKQATAGIIN